MKSNVKLSRPERAFELLMPIYWKKCFRASETERG